MNIKITLNPDEEYVKEMRESIKRKNGHCPCVLEEYHSADTICMCREFREQKESGYCHCLLYHKEVID